MRKQSIFASTKVVAQASASTLETTAQLTTDIVSYARQEVSASMKSSNLENVLDFSEDKTAGLKELFTKLAKLNAEPVSELRDLEIEILMETIATVRECTL